jgi:hypothetical protein
MRSGWLAVALMACDGGGKDPADDTDPVAETPTYSGEVQGIFDRHCASSGCHGGPELQTGLDLSPGQGHALLVGVPSTGLPSKDRVAAGDPDNSYLILKLRGTYEEAGGSGDLMPPGFLPLADNDIQVVVDWIAAGALDD